MYITLPVKVTIEIDEEGLEMNNEKDRKIAIDDVMDVLEKLEALDYVYAEYDVDDIKFEDDE